MSRKGLLEAGFGGLQPGLATIWAGRNRWRRRPASVASLTAVCGGKIALMLLQIL